MFATGCPGRGGGARGSALDAFSDFDAVSSVFDAVAASVDGAPAGASAFACTGDLDSSFFFAVSVDELPIVEGQGRVRERGMVTMMWYFQEPSWAKQQ